MNKAEKKTPEALAGTHLVILICYSILVAFLLSGSLLMGWEIWVLPLLVAGVAFSWGLHLTERIPASQRLWIYSILIQISFFFYGIHATSVFDIAPISVLFILMFSMTFSRGLINLCMASYYLTASYDLSIMIVSGYPWDKLTIARVLLHFLLVYMAGGIAKLILDRWGALLAEHANKVRELKEINRRTEDFLTNVSHEIRTPVNAVLGLSAVMLKKERNEALRQDLAAVKEAGQRVSEQINDILDYTEIDMGTLTVSKDSFMITSLVNDFLTDHHIRSGGECELLMDLDSTIPSMLIGDASKIKKILWHLVANGMKFTKSGCVYCRISSIKKPYGINLTIEVTDTGRGMNAEEVEKVTERFYQANSSRSRQAGGLGLGLSIVSGFVKTMGGFMTIQSEKGQGTTVRVSIPEEIADHVPCIAIAEKEKLCLAEFVHLEKFVNPKMREDYAKLLRNLAAGFGMNIHVASRKSELVALQKAYQLTHIFTGTEEYEEEREYLESLAPGIQIVVVAGEGYSLKLGSRAKILRKPLYSLPMASILNADKAGSLYEEQQGNLYCPGIRALVVDDEPMNLLVAEGIFRDYGMSVTTVESGIQALEVCRKESFDLIFMDHMMPDMDGVETMHRLRAQKGEDGRSLCIIALTANAVSSARDMFLSEGFDGFVSKPIELSELERTLKRVLPKSALSYEKPAEELIADANRESIIAMNDPLERLFTLNIDSELGLGYCRGDREFYKTLLLKFAQDAAGKQAEIVNAFSAEDWKNYEIRVHALKGTARMIGAEGLSALAKALEKDAKTGDTASIRENHPRLIEEYTALSEGLSALLDEAAGDNASAEGAAEISAEELAGYLEQLRECLSTFEADKAEELLSTLSGMRCGGEPLKEKLADISALVEDFELDKALERTKEMLGTMEVKH